MKLLSMPMFSPHYCTMPSALLLLLLLVSPCLLKGTAAALLDPQNSSSVTRTDLPSVTVQSPATVSTPSRQQSVLRETPASQRPRTPGVPRANLTLTLGGLLLLRRQELSENSISEPPLDRKEPVAVPGQGGQAGAPQSTTAPPDRATFSNGTGYRGRTGSPLTTDQQSRRLPPEFLAFPVYWSNQLSARKVGGGGRGGGRKPSLESPLAEQIVTTTSAPRRRQATRRPSAVTPSDPAESILPAPPAGCDAPGGPAARLAPRCRALRQLRQHTLQQRRRAAQRQAQQQLQRIIDLHLADATDSLAYRVPHVTPLELSRREPSPVLGTPTEIDSSRDGSLTPQLYTEQFLEDTTLLQARRVPPLIPAPRSVTKTTLTPGKRRRQKSQLRQTLSTSALTTGRPEWVPARVSVTEDGQEGAQRGTEDRSSRQGASEEDSSTHRGETQDLDRAQSKWRTYSSVSPNSIRTAPDKLEQNSVDVIDPFSTKPASLYTTTIVPVGGMPITQKGVIPGLLDIPARVYFSCRGRQPGFYGNPQTSCQVYHQCTADGKKYDYLCGVGTAFNAKTSTCDHWYNTACDRN